MNRQFHHGGFSQRGVRFPSKLDKHRGKDLIPVRARSVSFHNCGVIEFLPRRRRINPRGLRHGKRERGKNKA